MISPSVDNKMQEETTKSCPRKQITHMGERRRKKSSKEIKETLTSKQKANVNLMGSLIFYIQHKGICCCSDKRNSFKTILSYLKCIFPLSIPHPIK